jgi:Protein of unknown function (DUF2795)
MQNLRNFNPGDAARYLKGINFPASVQEVASALKNNGAPNEIIQKVQSAGKDQFSNEGDVTSTIAGL